jgi:hypothetical protein
VLREDPQTGEQTVRRLGPGQSAERSGQVRIGDVLLAVDGQPVAGRDIGELILGAEGSLVQLSFHRPGLEALDFTATLLRGSAEFVAAQAAANAPQAPAPSAAQKKAEMLLGAPPAPATAPFPPEAPAAPPAAPVPARTTPPAAPDGGGEVRVALQLRGAPDAALVPMVLPQTWAEFLGAASVRLQCGEVTRVFNDAGQPLMGMGDIAPGEKLLVHAAAKGQFEGWSAGMVIKRRYVLSTRLGEAGLGQLWQAVDTSTGLEVPSPPPPPARTHAHTHIRTYAYAHCSAPAPTRAGAVPRRHARVRWARGAEARGWRAGNAHGGGRRDSARRARLHPRRARCAAPRRVRLVRGEGRGVSD